LASVQYYLSFDTNRTLWKTAAHDFAESWGISLLPTVFLIVADGKLSSTEAEGELETLIQRLLEKATTSSSANRGPAAPKTP
jgi:hypothetical protein